jgi:hypothetical protein
LGWADIKLALRAGINTAICPLAPHPFNNPLSTTPFQQEHFDNTISTRTFRQEHFDKDMSGKNVIGKPQ